MSVRKESQKRVAEKSRRKESQKRVAEKSGRNESRDGKYHFVLMRILKAFQHTKYDLDGINLIFTNFSFSNQIHTYS